MVSTAWDSARTFRGSDMRVALMALVFAWRLKRLEGNEPKRLARVLSVLEPVAKGIWHQCSRHDCTCG